ncbi:putative conjugative transposon protein [Vibrio phage vB_VpaS_KF4]|nr:putative conjugative transposon protein [Vibrio phage vB_VpaS_KF3]ATI19266.1 putative conjugative transposon protein [Vibrio phage vB_VpaS_KF4]
MRAFRLPDILQSDTTSFNTDLAVKIGVTPAIILGSVAYSIEALYESGTAKEYDGSYWARVSTRKLSDRFPFLSTRTIERAKKQLVDLGLVRIDFIGSEMMDVKVDNTSWWSINEDAISKLSSSGDTDKMAETPCERQNDGVGYPPDCRGDHRQSGGQYKSNIKESKESSNEDSTPVRRSRRKRVKPEGFNVTKKERKPKKSTELTKHVLVLDQLDDEERPITKVEFDKIYDFVQKQKIALTEEELHAWLELNAAKLGLKIKTKRGVLSTIKNWVAGFTEAERWKLDKHLGKNTGQLSGRRTQRLNGNISAKHTESEIRVPPHLRKLMDKES